MSKQADVISRLRAGNRTPNEKKILAALMQPGESDDIDFERLIDSLDPTIAAPTTNSRTLLSAIPDGNSGLNTPESVLPAPATTNSTTPLSAKRNRSKMCADTNVHRAHEGCPGRLRAAKVNRPVCATVASALDAVWRKHGRHSVLHADSTELGIISADDIALYNLDVEKYEQIEFKQQDKFASFFTAVQRTNAIILDYAVQDLLPLTLRQIHYQMVVRHKDYPNTKTSYDHLAQDLVAARLAGFVPWNAIDDPTRGLHEFTGWESAQKRVADAAETFHLSRWANQVWAPIVLVEKDAALGIISRACNDLDVPYASCKGYGSVSALRNQVANHCRVALDRGKSPVVIHLSDHDASGWDMPRNLEEYLDLLVGCHVDMRHIALTLEQIAAGYGDGNPLPSDPVKKADPRSEKYIAHLAERGLEPGAWEMDALSPADLHDRIVNEIDSCRDMTLWKEVEEAEAEQKQTIARVAENWNVPLPNDGEMQ